MGKHWQIEVEEVKRAHKAGLDQDGWLSGQSAFCHVDLGSDQDECLKGLARSNNEGWLDALVDGQPEEVCIDLEEEVAYLNRCVVLDLEVQPALHSLAYLLYRSFNFKSTGLLLRTNRCSRHDHPVGHMAVASAQVQGWHHAGDNVDARHRVR